MGGAQQTTQETVPERLQMAATGAFAGLTFWWLFEWVYHSDDNAVVLVFLTSALTGFFTVLLALMGSAALRRTLLVAAVIALPLALLLGLSTLRFVDLDDFFDAYHLVAAWMLALCVAMPFAAAWLQDRASWRSYHRLFDHAWGIFVRYLAALIFVGLFWGVLGLSHLLLQLVGLNIIEDFLDIDPVPFVLSGLALGLALGVVRELRALVSPFLILRLLRLLLPVVLVVTTVFLVAIPINGIEGVFQSVSAAGTMLTVALAGITLITSALDKADNEAIQTQWMKYATKALATLLPLLAVFAIWAIWLRVAQYGWSPERLIGATVAGFVLAYALGYAGALISDQWMERIRRTNTVLAGALVVISVLWLTPILNVEAISARSHEARYMEGRLAASQVDLRELRNELGKPGRAAAARLAQLEGPEHAELRDRIAGLELPTPPRDRRPPAVQLSKMLTVLPEDLQLGVDALETLHEYYQYEWLNACRDADERGCVVILSKQLDSSDDLWRGLIVLPTTPERVKVQQLEFDGISLEVIGDAAATGRRGEILMSSDVGDPADYEVVPARRKAIRLGDLEFYIDN